MNFEIELRPHIGERRMPDGSLVKKELDQWMIFVSAPEMMAVRGRPEEHIGYVGKQPGMPINYLKVAAAFGQSSVQIFSQMVRVALLKKARERIDQARQAAEQAEALRAEADELIAEQRKLSADEAEAKSVQRIAEDAIEAANREILEAREVTAAEESTERMAHEPAAFYGRGNERAEGMPVDATGNSTGDSSTAGNADTDLSSEADSQNL